MAFLHISLSECFCNLTLRFTTYKNSGGVVNKVNFRQNFWARSIARWCARLITGRSCVRITSGPSTRFRNVFFLCSVFYKISGPFTIKDIFPARSFFQRSSFVRYYLSAFYRRGNWQSSTKISIPLIKGIFFKKRIFKCYDFLAKIYAITFSSASTSTSSPFRKSCIAR